MLDGCSRDVSGPFTKIWHQGDREISLTMDKSGPQARVIERSGEVYEIPLRDAGFKRIEGVGERVYGFSHGDLEQFFQGTYPFVSMTSRGYQIKVCHAGNGGAFENVPGMAAVTSAASYILGWFYTAPVVDPWVIAFTQIDGEENEDHNQRIREFILQHIPEGATGELGEIEVVRFYGKYTVKIHQLWGNYMAGLVQQLMAGAGLGRGAMGRNFNEDEFRVELMRLAESGTVFIQIDVTKNGAKREFSFVKTQTGDVFKVTGNFAYELFVVWAKSLVS